MKKINNGNVIKVGDNVAKDDFLLSQIAKMYYVDGIKQNEIARYFDMTPMMVSRSLKKAEQQKIVTIHIKMPWDQDMELGKRMRDQFQLKDCVVLNPSGLMDSNSLIARYFVDYFSSFVRNNMIVACSWGKTISEFASSLHFLNVTGCSIVQINGAVWSPIPSLMPTQILQSLSQRLNARSYPMNAPLYVDSASTKETLLQDPTNIAVQEMTKKADVVIIGASDLDVSATTIESNSSIMTSMDELRTNGAIGDLGGMFLDKDGLPIQWSKGDLYMGVPLDVIKQAKNVFCLAGGKGKASVLKAAAKQHYFTALITTKETALAMLEA